MSTDPKAHPALPGSDWAAGLPAPGKEAGAGMGGTGSRADRHPLFFPLGKTPRNTPEQPARPPLVPASRLSSRKPPPRVYHITLKWFPELMAQIQIHVLQGFLVPGIL